MVGAGYIGLEMAEGLTTRGLRVTQIEALPEVLPTVDAELGALVHAELVATASRSSPPPPCPASPAPPPAAAGSPSRPAAPTGNH